MTKHDTAKELMGAQVTDVYIDEVYHEVRSIEVRTKDGRIYNILPMSLAECDSHGLKIDGAEGYEP